MKASYIAKGLSMADYHADWTRVSKHGLDLVAKAPILYKLWKERQLVQEETDYFTEGRLIHTAILEPHKMHDECIVLPDDAPNKPTSRQRTAKKPSIETVEAIAWWDAFNAKADGKAIVTMEQAGKLVALAKAVKSNNTVTQLLSGVEGETMDTELSVYWTDEITGLPCRCRPDRRRSDGIVIDVKSCSDASQEAFERAAFNFRYHVQAAWYLDAIKAVGLPAQQFVFIAVEKEPPYLCNVFVASPSFTETGRIEYQKQMATLKRCLETGDWPGLANGPIALNLPKWA